nr:unnamed protein product [Callosobruchus analis]
MNIEKLAVAIIYYKILLKRKKKETAKQKCWMKLWIRRRVEIVARSTCTRDLEIEDAQQVSNFGSYMIAVQIQYTALSSLQCFLAALPFKLEKNVLNKKRFVLNGLQRIISKIVDIRIYRK